MSEIAPNPERQSPAGQRRVSLAVAIAVVLLCGALGILLGVLFPLDSVLHRSIHEPTTATTLHIEADVSEQPLTTAAPASQDHPKHHETEAAVPTTLLDERTPKPELPEVSKAPAKAAESDEAARRIEKPALNSARERRRATRERPARATRERYAAPKKRPTQPSIVSELPILGPVLGLFEP